MTDAPVPPTEALLDFIRRPHHTLLLTHVNPDPDGVGAMLAFGRLLERHGHTVCWANPSPMNPLWGFIPDIEGVRWDEHQVPACDAVVVLDVPTQQRLGDLASAFDGDRTSVCIDHHITNTQFARINWVDSAASSSGEMVYRLYQVMEDKIDADTALQMYVALIADTGSFRHSNTTPAVHHMAADLTACGVQPAVVHQALYEREGIGDLRLQSLALAGIQTTSDGRAAWMCISLDMLATSGARSDGGDLLIDLPRSLDGVEVAMVLRELQELPGEVRVSLRSKQWADVSRVAQQFGGGGHARAAGCTVAGSLSDVEQRVVSAVKAVVQE